MKKQFLFLAAMWGLTYGTAIAQNPDMDQRAENNSSISAFRQITDAPQTTINKTENNVALVCTADSMCPQSSTFSGNVRGYHFTAPVSFPICGLFIPTDASIDPQSIEVLRFDSLPPAYSAVTNSFVSLFYTASNTSTSMIPCTIPVSAGDIIGVYGARGNSSTCSYATGPCN